MTVLGWGAWEQGCRWCGRVPHRHQGPDVGAEEGDEKEKWGARRELCLLQGKGLCCHGIFIPLWEMETCDTPIKSAMVWQDGQLDPSCAPQGAQLLAGCPLEGGTAQMGLCPPPPDRSTRLLHPCRVWGGCHQLWMSPTPLFCCNRVTSQQQPQQRPGPSMCHLTRRGDKGVLLEPSGDPPVCPSQGGGMQGSLAGSSRQGCARAVLAPPSSARCPSDQVAMGPGVPRVSPPH